MDKVSEKIKWTSTGNGNQIIEADWGLISYNPCVRASMFDSGGQEETALMIEGKGYSVLNGDFRKEYEQAFPDKEACYNVYRKNIKNNSEWTSSSFK